MHPEAHPDRRNARKRQLLMTLMACPPVVVTFDSGHKGVLMPDKFKLGCGQQMRLDCNIDFKADALTVLADFGKDGIHTVELAYAAIFRISCIPLEETFIYNLDAEIAQARHRLYTSPARTLVH